ncbi:MAG: hypothetical protein HWE10_03240 [Gammaproteobacteria bacterium]|nr:hypothetical protein [Gammaproteobacteria bacterium]
MFGNTLVEHWKEIIGQKSFGKMKEFNSNALQTKHETLISEVIKLSRNSNKSEEQIKSALKKYFESYEETTESFFNHHQNAIKRANELSDFEKRALKLDFKERLRFLVFRILTAIGIAAVVLLTAYLADLWGIPLPFRMANLPT